MDESNSAQPPWSFDPTLSWQMLEANSFIESLAKIWQVRPGQLPVDARLFVMDLPFYSKHRLLCLKATVEGEVRHCFMLRGETTAWLDGSSNVIHKTNAREQINITQTDVAICYLHFFCSFVYGDFGPFLLLENVGGIQIPNQLEARAREHAERTLTALRSVITPITQIEDTPEGLLFAVSIYYGDTVFICKMKVHTSGMVEMLEDEPIVTDVPKGMISFVPNAYSIKDLLIEENIIIESGDFDGRAGAEAPASSTNHNIHNASQPNPFPQNAMPQTATAAATGQSASGQTAASNTPKFNSDREITRCYVGYW